ncbi:MAG: antibiotic biosynthesis monooxygenase [Thermoplasmata archaeon]|nr:antibiotic biosynthesis monooxygenase [Candidatus Thermoplasmatota archaeon]
MIARVWHGVTREADGESYLDYIQKTGVKDLRATAGNRGVYVLRRTENGRAEFLLISLWESLEAIRQFAGDDTEKAVYYPRDPDFLLEIEPEVTQYEVLVEP